MARTSRTDGRPARDLKPRGAALLALGLAALAAGALWTDQRALAQSAECIRLQQAIADASRNSQSERWQAAAQKQRGELDRTSAYARQIGCENHKFLFLGSDPPAQCGEINAQIARMQANLGNLQARAGGGAGGRGELMARYNAECVNGGRQPNIFDALFGSPPPPQPQPDMSVEPVEPDDKQELDDGAAHAGSKAVCVRTCDGYFFPVSYSAYSSRLDSLQSLCSALCPNAEVDVYTYSPSADIDTAVSMGGAPYSDLPNALKYRTSVDSSCTCRQRGQSWAEALANAEQMLGSQKHDIIVTPEKSVELSRPALDPKLVAKLKAPPPKPALETPSVASDPTAPDQLEKQEGTISRETSGIASGDGNGAQLLSTGKGETREIVGPDGVRRKVRIIDPML